MPDRDEIFRSLTGAWWLFLDRQGAMRHFTLTVDGFWRSFAAIVFVLPAYALAALAERQGLLTDATAAAGFSDAAFFLDKAVAIGLDWVSLPILLALLARPLGFSAAYPAFIVARNWSAVLAVLPFGLLAFLQIVGVLDGDMASFLSLAALIVVLRYNFLVARRALDCSIGFAVGIVVLDFVLSLALATAVDVLFGF